MGKNTGPQTAAPVHQNDEQKSGSDGVSHLAQIGQKICSASVDQIHQMSHAKGDGRDDDGAAQAVFGQIITGKLRCVGSFKNSII